MSPSTLNGHFSSLSFNFTICHLSFLVLENYYDYRRAVLFGLFKHYAHPLTSHKIFLCDVNVPTQYGEKMISDRELFYVLYLYIIYIAYIS